MSAVTEEMLTVEATIIRRSSSGSTDADGNAVDDETPIDVNCYLEALSDVEQPAEGETTVTDWRVVFPAGTIFTTRDALVALGMEFEAISFGDPFVDPFTAGAPVDHVEARLRRTKGAGDPS